MFLGTFNVFRKYKLLKFECFMLILPLNPSPHRSQWCGFSPVLLLKVSLATENTLIWILSRKTIHATLCVVPGNKSFVTDNPIIQILPSQTFMCLFRCFFYINFLPKFETLIISLGGSWRCSSSHREHRNDYCPQHDC